MIKLLQGNRRCFRHYVTETLTSSPRRLLLPPSSPLCLPNPYHIPPSFYRNQYPLNLPCFSSLLPNCLILTPSTPPSSPIPLPPVVVCGLARLTFHTVLFLYLSRQKGKSSAASVTFPSGCSFLRLNVPKSSFIYEETKIKKRSFVIFKHISASTLTPDALTECY